MTNLKKLIAVLVSLIGCSFQIQSKENHDDIHTDVQRFNFRLCRSWETPLRTKKRLSILSRVDYNPVFAGHEVGCQWIPARQSGIQAVSGIVEQNPPRDVLRKSNGSDHAGYRLGTESTAIDLSIRGSEDRRDSRDSGNNRNRTRRDSERMGRGGDLFWDAGEFPIGPSGRFHVAGGIPMIQVIFGLAILAPPFIALCFALGGKR